MKKHHLEVRVEKMMSLRQLAEHFNVSVNTAKALPIPYTMVGKRRQRRYRPEAVRHYETMNASQPLAWKEALSA